MGFTEMVMERLDEIEKKQTFCKRMLLVLATVSAVLFFRVLHQPNR